MQESIIGAIVDLGLCPDLTTKAGLEMVLIAYNSLVETSLPGDHQANLCDPSLEVKPWEEEIP